MAILLIVQDHDNRILAHRYVKSISISGDKMEIEYMFCMNNLMKAETFCTNGFTVSLRNTEVLDLSAEFDRRGK